MFIVVLYRKLERFECSPLEKLPSLEDIQAAMRMFGATYFEVIQK